MALSLTAVDSKSKAPIFIFLSFHWATPYPTPPPIIPPPPKKNPLHPQTGSGTVVIHVTVQALTPAQVIFLEKGGTRISTRISRNMNCISK